LAYVDERGEIEDEMSGEVDKRKRRTATTVTLGSARRSRLRTFERSDDTNLSD